jgi:hypothetical protein
MIDLTGTLRKAAFGDMDINGTPKADTTRSLARMLEEWPNIHT